MHRSSETVARLATALSKAQSEIANPQRCMIGTIQNSARDARPQTFRYASLAAGLEIVRRALGSHEIAVIQTTDIDRSAGAINLTTTLMHASGEWISSDWPVCQLGDVSMPRRMGAALTYARRYALFTLVGIAGEDDLDSTPEGAELPTGQTPNYHLTPSTSTQDDSSVRANKPGRQIDVPKPAPSSDSSAEIRDSIVTEIGALCTSAELELQAPRLLKKKNTLCTEDAKAVEAAFQAKLREVQEETIHATSESDRGELSAHQNAAHANPVALTDATGQIEKRIRTKRPAKSRSDKKQLKIALTEAVQVPFAKLGKLDDNSHEAIAPAKIDKSVLTISEPRRLRDKAHLRFVASQPCLICERSPCDAHHLRFAQLRALGRKSSDEFTVPLCRSHHRDNHRHGKELQWWSGRQIDPLRVAAALWAQSHFGRSVAE